MSDHRRGTNPDPVTGESLPTMSNRNVLVTFYDRFDATGKQAVRVTLQGLEGDAQQGNPDFVEFAARDQTGAPRFLTREGEGGARELVTNKDGNPIVRQERTLYYTPAQVAKMKEATEVLKSDSGLEYAQLNVSCTFSSTKARNDKGELRSIGIVAIATDKPIAESTLGPATPESVSAHHSSLAITQETRLAREATLNGLAEVQAGKDAVAKEAAAAERAAAKAEKEAAAAAAEAGTPVAETQETEAPVAEVAEVEVAAEAPKAAAKPRASRAKGSAAKAKETAPEAGPEGP